MRIAYCVLYTEKNYEEISENIDQLLDAGDDVYIMVNDDEIRDDLFLAYVDEPRVQISQHQQVALPADLSLPRGWLMQIQDAFDFEAQEQDFEYDYFITLTDGMLPLVSKEKMDEFLEGLEGKDCFYETSNTNEDEELKQRIGDYAFFTNSFEYQKSKFIRGMNSMTANVVRRFKQREVEDTIYLTYPWFILTRKTAETLIDHFEYCSNTFMMCQYPEEMAFGTMIHKFCEDEEHVNKDFVLCGPNGHYEYKKAVESVSYEMIKENTDKIFAAKIHSDDNLYTYMETFDIYHGLSDDSIYESIDEFN